MIPLTKYYSFRRIYKTDILVRLLVPIAFARHGVFGFFHGAFSHHILQ